MATTNAKHCNLFFGGLCLVFLKKGSHGARCSGLVFKEDKGKVTVTNMQEYTEDTKGSITRQQNKGDLQFRAQTMVASWLIQKGGHQPA